jgi:flavin-dependent dehydrogenase
MIEADVIIVGGGPAGTGCARELTAAGYSTIILDKADFPRDKLCAGWVTPRVFRLLGTSPKNYPYGLSRFRTLHFRLKGVPVALPTRQFAIRRFEFDRWLLERSGAPLYRHRVQRIEKDRGRFVVDGLYAARSIVGAGGTQCPVARSFFVPSPGAPEKRIVTLEEEFRSQQRDERCFLWFFEHGLPGYAWYFPKADGYVAVGVGGVLETLQDRGSTIRDHWNLLTEKLEQKNILTGHSYRPSGHSYYLRGARERLQQGRVYLVGDAAGLATRDMGEGIGPAIHSGILAARAIAEDRPYSVDAVGAYSMKDLLFPPALPS